MKGNAQRLIMALAFGLGAAALYLAYAQKQKTEQQQQDWESAAHSGAAPKRPVDGGAALPPSPGAANSLRAAALRTLELMKTANARLAGAEDAKPAPLEEYKKMAFGMFVVPRATLQQAVQALQAEQGEQELTNAQLAHGLYLRWSTSSSVSAQLLQVEGRADPGPGVNASLLAAGCSASIPKLFDPPELLEPDQIRTRRLCLDHAVKRATGGEKGLGQRAALWRAKLFDPELASRIGDAPPLDQPLTKAQRAAAMTSGSGPEAQLIQSLRQALLSSEHKKDALLVLIKTIPI